MLFVIFVLFSLFQKVLSDNLNDDIYFNTKNSNPCVRLLDKNGQFGCSTPRNGLKGILFLFDSQKKIDTLSPSTSFSSIIAVIDPLVFNKQNIEFIKNKVKLNGILLLSPRTPPNEFSGENKSPQNLYNPTSTIFDWNPNGNSFLYDKYDFGIVQLSMADSIKVKDLAEENEKYIANKEHIRHYAVMKYYMFGGNSSLTCLKENKCLPLGGYSVQTTLGQSPILNDSKLIVVSTRMDATAFIHGNADGADSAVSGLVIMLAAFKALLSDSDFLNRANNSNKQIVFMVFQGESYGFLGSRKFADDLINFNCTEDHPDLKNACLKPYATSRDFENFNLSNVEAQVDLQQIGLVDQNSNKTDKFWYYSNGNNAGQALNNLVSKMSLAINGIDLEIGNGNNITNNSTPPNSLQAFNKIRTDIPGIVITDHGGEFVNKYYQSQQDRNLNINFIFKMSTQLVRFLDLLTKTNMNLNTNLEIDQNFIRELVHCFLETMSCGLVRDFIPNSGSSTSKYTSIYQILEDKYITNKMSLFIHRFMAETNSYNKTDKKCTKESDCDKNKGQRCGRQKCVYSNTNFHSAVDPVLDFNFETRLWDYNESRIGETLLFTESNWISIRTYLYRVESPFSEQFMFGLGLVVVFLSLIISLCSKKFCKKRFKML